MRLLRALFLLLVLANLVVFAYGQGIFGGYAAKREGQRLSGQLHPDRLVVVAKGEAAIARAPAPAVCREFAGLTADQAQRLTESARSLGAEVRATTQRSGQEPTSWWVFLPPQGSRQDAERRAAELRNIRITDYFVIPEAGANQWAISLGVYNSEAKAREALESFRGREVHDARMAGRDSGTTRISLRISGAQEPMERLTAQAATSSTACPT